MYFISEPNDLIGKEIGFIHANRFCDSTIIVTKDVGVLIVKQVFDLDEDQTNTIVFNECRAKKELYENRYAKHELNRLKIITKKDWADYELKLKKAEEARQIEYQKKKEEQERLEYERLKLKFEGQ